MAKRAKTAARFKIKRVYEPAAEDDGLRVLVDRLWPRGLTKQKARIDLWLKEIAPSVALRRRFHSDRTNWREFVAAYRQELKKEPAKSAAANLREQIKHGRVTLLYATRNEAQNNAVALKDWLEQTGRV
jgi:uncharacterized protein YeaO (DUF488 family)